ncbi:MAG: WecB/TagA/CpsF family glycosyltransferase [Ardenticatenales bacterium]|nr:WecB/TagA/CpsF family glycosyltransferase [Ardenticatenales bacterium]
MPLPLPTPCDIAGIKVHPLSLAALLQWLAERIAAGERGTVMYVNAHAINLAQVQPAFREHLNRADVVFCDGYGVRLGAALLGCRLPERFTPPDWIARLAALCTEHRYRLFFLGARPGVAACAADTLRVRFPTLEISTHHGHFDLSGPENEAVLEQICVAAPHILLVGMGMPRQEAWMVANHLRHPATIVISVGALFDYMAGEVRRGPAWMTEHGGEWLARLWYEPRRLWRRYLLGNPAFLWLILQIWARKRRLRS